MNANIYKVLKRYIDEKKSGKRFKLSELENLLLLVRYNSFDTSDESLFISDTDIRDFEEIASNISINACDTLHINYEDLHINKSNIEVNLLDLGCNEYI